MCSAESPGSSTRSRKSWLLEASLATSALGTAAVLLRAIRIPGDHLDPHETNSFGLPDGRPIKTLLVEWFERQREEVLARLPATTARAAPGPELAPLPDRFEALADYDDPMASAMTPVLAKYWDEAGQVTRTKLGLDPDEWTVTDPHVEKKIQGDRKSVV